MRRSETQRGCRGRGGGATDECAGSAPRARSRGAADCRRHDVGADRAQDARRVRPRPRGSRRMSRLLSIGITTRNRPDALAACLASLSAIAHLDPEVLVFDDGSQPPVSASVRVISDTTAPGYIVGRNRLVREADGEFVLLMDDDTRLIGAAAIDEAIAVLRGDAGVGAVAFAQAEADGRPWPASMQPSAAKVPTVVPSFIGFA